jgi:hypothetical protein
MERITRRGLRQFCGGIFRALVYNSTCTIIVVPYLQLFPVIFLYKNFTFILVWGIDWVTLKSDSEKYVKIRVRVQLEFTIMISCIHYSYMIVILVIFIGNTNDINYKI